MRSILFAVSLAVFVLSFGLQPRVCAADTETLSDAHCILVLFHLAALKGPKGNLAATMGEIYFLGRLDGHSPHADIEHLLASESQQMNTVKLSAESERCSRILKQKGHELQKIGADYSFEGKHGMPQ